MMNTPADLTTNGAHHPDADERLPAWARMVGRENVALRKGTLRRSVVFNAMSAAAQICSSFLGTVLLARMLAPSDFAAYGIISPIVVTLMVFADAGTAYITLRSPSLQHRTLSELFSAALMASMACLPLAMGAIALAVWVAGRPDALVPGLILALSILTTGLAAQHSAMATRGFRNDLRVLVTFVSAVGALCIALTLAALGAGLYALVGLFFSRTLISMVMYHVLVRWRPDFRPPRQETIGDLRRLGLFELTSRSVMTLSMESDKLLAGLLLAPTPAGLYVLSHMLIVTGARYLMQPILNLLVPYFTEVRSADHYGAHVLGTFRLFTVAMAPGALWLALSADDVLGLVLGRDDEALVMAVSILCAGLSIEIMSRCSGAVFGAADMPKKTVQIQVIAMLTKVGVVLLTAMVTVLLGAALTVTTFVLAVGAAMVFAGLFRLYMVATTFEIPLALVVRRLMVPYVVALLSVVALSIAVWTALPGAGPWDALGRVALGLGGVGAVTLAMMLVFVRDHPIVRDVLGPRLARLGRRAGAA